MREHQGSPTAPRKVHYRNVWQDKMDAVYWVNLSHAQDLGLQFWQIKSNAFVIEDHVPAICIYRVTFLEGEQILYERAFQLYGRH